MPKKIKPLQATEIPRKPIPETGFRDYSDGKGLRLRVWHTGTRAWMFRYTVKASGTTRLMKLGNYPALGLAAARVECEKLRGRVRHGEDPLGDLRQQRAEALLTAEDTLGDLIDWYLRAHAPKKLAPRTRKDYERYLTVEPPDGDYEGRTDIADLRKITAREVTTADVAKWLDKFEGRNAMTSCNRAQSALSAVFTWAIPRRRLGVEANPVRGLPRRYDERGAVKRWLTEAELGTVFGAMPAILEEKRPTVPQWATDALWLILATGQRPGEVLQMRWEHVTLPSEHDDDQHGRWAMPPAYRKRVRGQRVAPPHDVPLAPLVVKRLQGISGKSGFVFRVKGGHKTTNDLNQRVQRGLLKAVDVEPFTPHDLRRTCRTHLANMGVPQHIAKKILGHVDSSVDAVYDRARYWDERLAALDAWAERLREIVG